jgi:tRNA threonylcarbamoyl adenosine modification protein (Sua5/YciO/YrdC/YwlC family)
MLRRMAALCISLQAADRPRLVQEVVQSLRAGELCVLPTETVYGLAALPSVAAARQRVQALKGRAADHRLTLHVDSATAAASLAQLVDPRARRLSERYWPGPLTLVLPNKGGAGDLGLRVPAHDFTRAVLRQLGEPLWLTSVNRSGRPPLCEPAAIAREFGGQLARIVDDGPSPLGTASTVVRCTGPALEVLREGILSRREVLQTAAALVLFVCTGNTCRSPLAEALARDLAAQALGIATPDLLARGLWFASAGISTLGGMPASDGSIAVGADVGLDLQAHRSTELTTALVERAAQILCLSRSHFEAVVDGAPAAADRTALLHPDGSDIADPYGGSIEDYRRARDQITAAVQARVGGWLDLIGAR